MCILRHYILTVKSRSAVAAKPRCSMCKLWQKYKYKKCASASNIALSYSVDVDK